MKTELHDWLQTANEAALPSYETWKKETKVAPRGLVLKGYWQAEDIQDTYVIFNPDFPFCT